MELTFEEFWEDLNNGFEFTYEYLDAKYSISKMNKNCYVQTLVEGKPKKALTHKTTLSLKMLKEVFPDFKDLEYTVISNIK